MSVNSYVDIVLESGSQLHRNCIQWKIRHFLAHLEEWLDDFPPDREWVLQTPEYSTNSGKIWDLTIKFYPDCLNIEIDILLRSLNEEDTTFSSVCIHTKLSLIVDGEKYETQQETIKNISPHHSECIWKMKIDDFQKLTEKKLKKDDTFRISFEIEEWTEKTDSQDIVKCLPTGNTIINFFTDQTLTDVTLECQGKKFKAHKLILAAASPVFQAMFKEGTKEHQESCVIIDDIDSDVFEVFLRFLYSGQVDKLDEMCLDLFGTADKYDVQPLREICLQHIATNISVKNAVDILALAERHSIKSTKSLALKFIKLNFTDVVKTDSWCSLLANHPGPVKRLRDGGLQTEESAGKRKK